MLGPAKKKPKPRKPHWSTTVPQKSRKCKHCGKKFKSPWPSQIYCSGKCGNEHRSDGK
jgi:hypothetical protein